MKKTLALAASLLAFASLAFAQAYPTRPIRMLVTYPAGGGADPDPPDQIQRVLEGAAKMWEKVYEDSLNLQESNKRAERIA